MLKIKKILAPIVFIALSVAVIFVVFSEFNILPDFDFRNLFGISSVSGEDYKTNEQLIDELKSIYLESPSDSGLSDSMNALWIDINKDISASADDGTDAVKYCIYTDFDYYRNFVPDTVFVKPDTQDEYKGLYEPDGSDFDVLGYLLYYVRDTGCDAVLVADDSILLNSLGKPHTDKLRDYLTRYSFDGVLISVDAAYSEALYYECAEAVSEFMKDGFFDLSLGIEIHSDFEKQFADDYVTAVVQNGLVDFGYVDLMCTSGDSEYPFQSVALWWNYFAEYYKLPLYCEHRSDLIFSAEGDWSFSTEINNQLRMLYACQYFNGSCYYNSSVLKTKKALARDLSIFLNDVSGSNDDSFEVDSLKINGNTVEFEGCAVESNNVFCNDDMLRLVDGRFSYSKVMNTGLNEFVFFSNGAVYEYSLYENSTAFSSYSRDSEIKPDIDMYVTAYAVCPDEARVFAVVNGSFYELIKSENQATSYGKGLSYFSGRISLFGKEIVSDELQLVCFYDNACSVVSCGSIKSGTSSANQTVPTDTFSPYNDNGLGTVLMCITKSDNTEIIGEVNEYDTYKAYNSSLPKGTIDYVENINVSSGGYLRYELASGLNIYGTDAVLINNGYKLPLNRISLVNREINAGDTSFVFDIDWLAPVTVTVTDADFYKGYEGFSYNIDSFDAQYVDINFRYSDNLTFNQQMLMENDPLFSRYEVFVDSVNSKLILRLHLRNPGCFYGYDILTDSDGRLKISFKNFEGKTLNGKVVMLDAGHGGISMVGTALNDNSVAEAQITLGVAHAAKKYLEQMGATVIMTRIMDTSLTLSERTYMCETKNPDIFVSIHCDGADDTTESGTHTFYFTPFSHKLALDIHNSIVNAYSQKIYVAADDNFARIDRKIKYYPFYVTRVDNCPSVLIETGFLTNFVEGNVLAAPANQDIIGNAIALGINDYFCK